MILGLGTDIIEISRIQESIERLGTTFINTIYTEKEISYCQKHANPYPRFAGRWAAKESVAKALGCGFGSLLSFLDIEIASNSEGAPYIIFSEEANRQWNHPLIQISISHCKLYATAVAIRIQ